MIYPWCMSLLIETHSLWWDEMLSLNEEGGAWSFPYLMCLTLFTPYGSPYLLWRVDRCGLEERWGEWKEGWEGKLWLEFKTKKNICFFKGIKCVASFRKQRTWSLHLRVYVKGWNRSLRLCFWLKGNCFKAICVIFLTHTQGYLEGRVF